MRPARPLRASGGITGPGTEAEASPPVIIQPSPIPVPTPLPSVTPPPDGVPAGPTASDRVRRLSPLPAVTVTSVAHEVVPSRQVPVVSATSERCWGAISRTRGATGAPTPAPLTVVPRTTPWTRMGFFPSLTT
jgi:hypothetical protein